MIGLTLLQIGTTAASVALSSTSYRGSTSQMGAYFLMIIIGIIGYLVQAQLQRVFKKYAKVAAPQGLSGAEAAEKMLRDNNVHDVKIISTPGHLTDHYNPATKTVNLSQSVYAERSVAAVAVACHECGHAIQHARAYAPLQMRSALVPIVNISSRMATWVIIGGLIMVSSGGSGILCWVGIAMIAASALFSLITLPVEYNASARALEWMKMSRIANTEEIKGASVALKWAARTYLVAALSAIATLLYYIMLFSRRN